MAWPILRLDLIFLPTQQILDARVLQSIVCPIKPSPSKGSRTPDPQTHERRPDMKIDTKSETMDQGLFGRWEHVQAC